MPLIQRIRDALRAETVYAHCDIPCGIYDPHAAQVAAHTVYRMTQLAKELPGKDGDDLAKRNSLIRYIEEKERHAEICKQELRILWGDYFKPEHLEKYPKLHDTFWNALKTASSARQGLDLNASESLIKATNEIAEIFWTTKGKKTQSVKAPYPTEQPIVLPQ